MENKKYIKSPLNYTRGKYKILDKIIPKFPSEINTFVDLFSGGFNVGINVEANRIICNDNINYLIELYEYIKETETEELILKIKQITNKYELNKTNKEGYLKLRNEYNLSKKPILLFILICFSFNHMIRFNNDYQFNVSFGKDRSEYNMRIEENLKIFSETLKQKEIIFTSLDFFNVDLSELGKEDFVYYDPPYLISDTSYNKNWTEKEEKELLEILDILNARNIKFALSNVLYHKGQENKILAEWSQKYKIHYIDISYSNCNYQLKDRENKSVEVLVTNY
jgi:modification methylase fokI